MSPNEVSEILISADQIRSRTIELGQQIARDYQGQELVVVGVLTGASIFVCDLIREIHVPLTLDFVSVSSYGESTRSSGEVRLIKDIGHPVEGKNILIVEDIIDTGLTLRYLLESIQARHPASVKSCVLLDKPSARKVEVPVDYCGFQIEDKFVVGYGLDYAGYYRNLPYIGILQT